ncbi:MAG: hypothetical protein AAF682_26460 [Planctomycetota bacterium]
MDAPAPHPARELWLLFLVALALRVLAMVVLGSPAEVDGFSAWRWGHEPASLADALLRGDGLADPFGRDTGPSGWLPPIYPALVAACMWLFGGVTAGAAWALYGVQSVASALTAPLLLLLGRRLGAPGAGRLAAWAWVLHPLAIWYAVHKVWDTALVAAGMTGFAVLLLGSGRAPGRGRTAVLGAAFGLLLLLNPAPVGILPAVLLYLAPERPWTRALPRAAAFVAATALVCSPWMARNLVVLGTPGLRSNLGVELYVGNNDLADGQHRFEYHPGWTDAETERLRELGEAEYSSACGRQALDWIRANPGRFASLTLTRARIVWLGELPLWDRRTFFGTTSAEDPKSWARWVLHLVGGVLGALGALRLARRSPEHAFLVGSLVLFPLPYYVIHVLERYRFPVEPYLLLLAAAFVLSLRKR